MKSLLINPSYPSYPFPFIPVGLGYLSESLLNHGIDHDVVDLNYEKISDLHVLLQENNYKYVCISLTSLDILHNYKIIENIKNSYNVCVVAGGPHVSFVKENALYECPNIDCAVLHEGEHVLPEIIKGKPFSNIKGVIYKDDKGQVVVNEPDAFISDLDSLIFPKYQKFLLSSYDNIMPISSSRGCPFNCTFCGAHLSMGKKWRYRSVAKVIEEIAYWYERGYRKFNFIDSEFFASSQRILELSSALHEFEGKITFTSDGMRADSVREDVVICAKKFGLKYVSMGVESANDDILKNIKKGERLCEIEDALLTLGKHHIAVQAFFIIGLPGETFMHVLRSLMFSLKFKNIFNVHFFNVNPLYGTELYNWYFENGYLFDIDALDMYQNIGGMNDKVLLETEELSLRERKVLLFISKIVKKIVKYKFLFCNFSSAPYFSEFRNYIKNVRLDSTKKYDHISKIETHLTVNEKYKLCELASQKIGTHVEIGSYLGASSCFIAEGILSSGGQSILYCVDTWKNDAMSEGKKDTFETFKKNTVNYEGIINTLTGDSKDVAKNFGEKIDFLFIDGDHSYDGVMKDVSSWFDKLNPGALLVFHDYGWAEGVQRVVNNHVRSLVVNEGSLPNMWWGWLK